MEEKLIYKAISKPPKKIQLSKEDCQRLCSIRGLQYLDGFENRVIEYVISDEKPDRMGDIVRADGIDYSDWDKSAVIHLSHDTSRFPIGNSIKTWYDAAGKSLKSWALFLDDRIDNTGLSDTAYRMASSGFMKGASIGFLPVESNRPESEKDRQAIGLSEYGREYLKTKMLEYSVCSVPCNPNALTQLAIKSKSIKDTIKIIESLNTEEEMDKTIIKDMHDKLDGLHEKIDGLHSKLEAHKAESMVSHEAHKIAHENISGAHKELSDNHKELHTKVDSIKELCNKMASNVVPEKEDSNKAKYYDSILNGLETVNNKLK
jgi:hypothetical protein